MIGFLESYRRCVASSEIPWLLCIVYIFFCVESRNISARAKVVARGTARATENGRTLGEARRARGQPEFRDFTAEYVTARTGCVVAVPDAVRGYRQ